MTLKLTVGCDPEFFLRDKHTGHHVSAHDLLPGTKEAPFPVKKGAVQVDGTACEFNTDPASSEDEFVENVTTVIGELRKLVPDRYDFDFSPVVHFEPMYFNALPFKAVQLGCTPDFDGYTFNHNPIPDPGGVPFRTASGHIHVGWQRNSTDIDEDHILTCGRLARNLDWYLGVPSLKWDRNGAERRKLYGKAGCFRPKPYGFEYRTLSNAWLKSEILMRRVYRGTIEGCTDYFSKGTDCTFMKRQPGEAQKLLNG